MTQKDQVIVAMKKNGGYATLQQLNRIIDTSSWGTKTPDATIRRIESSPFLCVNSSFSYIKYVYAAFIFSNVL